MDKYIYDDKNGLWYELQGDYYIPCLILPAEKEQPIGLWGQRHLRYLKEYRRATYITLFTSGRLNNYLADIDRQAQERMERLTEQMKRVQGITEQLKAENALEWTQRMNKYTHNSEYLPKLRAASRQPWLSILSNPVR